MTEIHNRTSARRDHSLVALGFLASLALGAGAGAAGFPETALIDDCQYADNAAAQARWEPMGATRPATVAVIEGRKRLQLSCNFVGTKIPRASWDGRVKLDLSSCQGIQFQLLCRDVSPVSQFSLYFQSGAGWYHSDFFPESADGWNTIKIDKATMGTEGKPAGWGEIQTIRISAWRGKDADTELFVSDLRRTGVLGEDAAVAVVRGDAGAKDSPAETRSVGEYAERVARHLRALEIGCAVISDTAVTAERLREAKVVVLPYNPQMSDRVADELRKYALAGGKLLVFYTVPEPLRGVLGVGRGEHLPAPRPGYFSTIRFVDRALPGAPATASQRSWNINALQPVPGVSQVLAEWLDDQGQRTGHAAVLGSTNGVVMTHVLLAADNANQRRMLLAMIGRLAPAIWQRTTEASLARIGILGGAKNFDEAASLIARGRPESEPARQAMSSARAARTAALELAARRDFASALELAEKAERDLLQAYCLAQRPLPGEFRAFWCHSAFGVEGMEWDEALGRLAENGFNAILPNMLWGGAAFYASNVLPVAPQVATRGDQIAKCLTAGRKHGVQVHVWKVNWYLGHAAPKEFIERMRREQRLQSSVSGAEELWLCPSHAENQRLEIAAMVEVARQYDVDGIHFDYIRYPGSDHCFCGGCKERFQRAVGAPVENWPGAVLGDAPLRPQWLDWRRSNITAVVKAVSEQARAIKPKLKLSAAVFRLWNTDRDGVGQDWKVWCDEGYLDFVCPMDYTPSNRSFEGMVAQQVRWAGRVPCYPGIGVSASASRFGPDRVIEQINISRRYQTGGFIIFNYGVAESRELLPLLGLGITAKR